MQCRISLQTHSSSDSEARLLTLVLDPTVLCLGRGVGSPQYSSPEGKLSSPAVQAPLPCPLMPPWSCREGACCSPPHYFLVAFCLKINPPKVCKAEPSDLLSTVNVIHNFTPEIYNPLLRIKSFLPRFYIYSTALLWMETLGVISLEINKPSAES